MTDNPYYSPDADADILSDAKTSDRRHSLDGTVCPTCGVMHQVSMPPEIPEEVLDRLSDFLDTLPHEALVQHIIVTSASSAGTKVLRDFVEFAKETDKHFSVGPVLRALCEVVDEISAGKLSKLVRLYEAEGFLLSTHTVLKSVNNLHESFSGRDDLGEHKETIMDVFATVMDAVQERLESSRTLYRVASSEVGSPVDDDLVIHGVYSGKDNLFRSVFMRPKDEDENES